MSSRLKSNNKNFKKVAELKALEVSIKDSNGDELITFTGVGLEINMNLSKVKSDADLDYYAWQVAQEMKNWAKGRLKEVLSDLSEKEGITEKS